MGKHPEEVYVCPRGFDGDYTIRIDSIYNNEKKPASRRPWRSSPTRGRRGSTRRRG